MLEIIGSNLHNNCGTALSFLNPALIVLSSLFPNSEKEKRDEKTCNGCFGGLAGWLLGNGYGVILVLGVEWGVGCHLQRRQ
jgi:hypothetical protein